MDRVKSGAHYASRYAEDNKVAAHCVVEMGNFSKDLTKHEETFDVNVRSVIIVDDVVGTGRSLSDNLQKFMQVNRECIRLRNPAIRVVVLAATVDGQIKVREKLKPMMELISI
jgi:hypoxanthine-guanine phosphoribosyltransferase